MQKKTTMTDIAKALGVSQTLVSFVFSGKNDMGISSDTKKKVFRTAEKMGYLSSTASRMLRSGRCGYAALAVSPAFKETFSGFIGVINKAFGEYGYSLVIPGTPGEIDAQLLTSLFADKKADGILILGEITEYESFAKDIPAVTISSATENSIFDSARLLCEKILSCTEDATSDSSLKSKKKSAAKKGSSKKSASKKIVDKPITDNVSDTSTEDSAPQSRSRNESIWLL